jgi:hypothetical protein
MLFKLLQIIFGIEEESGKEISYCFDDFLLLTFYF